jgi:hypothetical protein
MKRKTITVTTTNVSTISYIVTVLMLSTAIIYFVAASQEYSELSTFPQSNVSSSTASKVAFKTNEMMFFIIVGIAYVIVGLWIIKRKYHSKIPYIVAATGSAVLIVFYIATRVISLPVIGLHSDIDPIDVIAKVLQSSIIVGSLLVLGLSRRFTTMNR